MKNDPKEVVPLKDFLLAQAAIRDILKLLDKTSDSFNPFRNNEGFRQIVIRKD